jgi:hypothetical protein
METKNVSSEANSEPAETVLDPSTVQASLAADVDADVDTASTPITAGTEPKPSYVKLAMRNMVRKRGLSLQHFFLTTVGLLAVFIGLAYLTR